MKEIFLLVEVLGVLAFAWSGYIEARRKEMDPVGAFTIAFITAFGGGTIRDVLLEQRPLVWVQHQAYPLMIFALAIVAYGLERHWRDSPMLQKMRSERAIVVPDALGMALFNAGGVALAWQLGNPPFVAIMMGVITSIFGGVLRDVFCNEIPLVFRRGTLYATCAFLGGGIYVVLMWCAVAASTALLACMVVTASFRLLAVKYGWRLP
ncbi:trimeric intracellular cation channel family protein [Parvibium lacunae]|uniref:Trimeric intracellular cation channel family protein n=1 Tax=Parvibium lacunae TaxID=1888893 RepID=A0A368L6Y9_9BURK|nr:trimeric intracellular cation channel family protein [Parvibium lacunae]RCS59430.1 trimeric intracellular cation channel family protein [Parvibium lacunae]